MASGDPAGQPLAFGESTARRGSACPATRRRRWSPRWWWLGRSCCAPRAARRCGSRRCACLPASPGAGQRAPAVPARAARSGRWPARGASVPAPGLGHADLGDLGGWPGVECQRTSPKASWCSTCRSANCSAETPRRPADANRPGVIASEPQAWWRCGSMRNRVPSRRTLVEQRAAAACRPISQ